MYSRAHVLLIRFAGVSSMASSSAFHCGSKDRYCEVCAQTLREYQYDGHLQGKKHKKRLEGRHRPTNDKGIEIPSGTAFFIEQTALYNDAVLQYVYSLYNRAALRSRL